jgi:hypothetical protein
MQLRAMSFLSIRIGTQRFRARLLTEHAPRTCAALLDALPIRDRLIHVRWSGEAMWVPLGGRDWGIGPENATSYPAPGEILLHPAGISESEILIAYGPTCFASKAGQLAGNHCLTIVDNLDALRALGPAVLYDGAREIEIARE